MRKVGLDEDQVVEILTAKSENVRDARGSGYRVVSDIVLTAAHAVAGATSIRVRCNADRSNEWTAFGELVWIADEIDVALVRILELPDESSITPVAFGRVIDQDGILHCSAMGFPRFKLRSDRDVSSISKYRDSAHVIGDVAVFSNRREGTFSITVPPPEGDPDPSHSPWEGMSGAALWSGGVLVGMITMHHSSDGLATIAASRVDRWHDQLTSGQLAELGTLIQFPSHASLLAPVAVDDRSTVSVIQQRHRAVQVLMQAESQAWHDHAYRLSVGAPHLDRVYVEPSVILSEENSDDMRAPIGAQYVPVTQIFTAHQRLLIEGGPGQGKSTVVKHVAGTLADTWLAAQGIAQPAIRIPAVDLADDAPLATLLRNSVRRRFGIGLLQEVPEAVFESAVAGTPWLLLVDGLDEISDSAIRSRVISAIAGHATNSDAPHRWVVTTRPVEGAQTLLNVGFTRVVLAPFTDEQLESLARRWFTNTPDLADAFLGRFLSSPSVQLIRTPLLAAVALELFRRDPRGRPIQGRPAMYQEFVTYLLSARGDERRRQEILRRAVADGGGTTALAEWLQTSRVQLLTYLAQRTLDGQHHTLDLAVAWTRQNATEPVDFLRGWAEIVSATLAGTGLLVRDRESDELQWLHRSFAEYLAARAAAAPLPQDWPGDEFDQDPTITAALLGTDGDLALLTIAIWASNPRAATERFIEALLRRSGGYRVYGRKPSTFIRYGDDSNEPDHYAALAGRLTAEGIHLTDPTHVQVLERLVIRAKSIFHGQEFCGILATHPHRDQALVQLERLALDTQQPMQARVGAVAAIIRTFGLVAAAAAAADSLSHPVGDGQWFRMRTSFGGATLSHVDDARVIAAEQLTALGPIAHEIVQGILQNVKFGLPQDGARIAAAEAWLALGQNDRAIEIIQPTAQSQTYTTDVVSLLLRLGDNTAATRIVDDLVDHFDAEDGARDHTLMSVAHEALAVDIPSFARSVATAVLDKCQQQSPAWAYVILIRLGEPEPVVARMRQQPSYRPAHWTWTEWARAVRELHQHGHTDTSNEALNRASGHTPLDGSAKHEIGELLIELGDQRGEELCLAAAKDPEYPIHLRVRAAQALLDTSARESAIRALRDIASGPLDRDWGSTDLASALIRAGHLADALDLLDREIIDAAATRGEDNYWSTRRTDAIEALDVVGNSRLQSLLVQLVDNGMVAASACIDIAKTLERLGDADRALSLVQSFVKIHDPHAPSAESLVDNASWELPRAFVKAARLLYRLGDLDTVRKACQYTVRWAATGETDLRSVLAAVAYLDDIDSLGSDELALVRMICTRVLQEPGTNLWHTKDDLIELINRIARHPA